MKGIFDTRPPRGAVAVIAVGLFATLAAAVLTNTSIGGSSVVLEWVKQGEIADSGSAEIPGGGSMQLVDGGLSTSEENINGERIYRVTSTLAIAPNSAVGQARVRCRMRGGPRSELGRTVNSRGAFPRSSGEYNLTKQDVPGSVGIRFHSRGAEFASLEFEDAFDAFTGLKGVVVSWAHYSIGHQEWQWGLPEGRPAKPLTLGFASFWRSTGPIEAHVSCTLENASGAASVRTSGRLAEPAA